MTVVYDGSQNEKEMATGHGRMKTGENEKESGETERWNSLLGVNEHGKCVGLLAHHQCGVCYLH